MGKVFVFFLVISLCLAGPALAERVVVGGQGIGGGQSSRDACPVITQCPAPEPHSGGLAYDGTYLWSTLYFASTTDIYQIDPGTCSVVSSIPGPSADAGGGLAFDGSSLWVSVEQEGMIYEVNPSNGNILSFIPAPGFGDPDPGSSGLAFDGTYLWHADYGHETIYKLDPADGTILFSFPSPGICPAGLGYYEPGDVLILADCQSNELYQIDPSDGSINTSCGAPGGFPWGVAVMGGTVWESEFDGILFQLDSDPVATEVQSWGTIKSTYR